MDKLEGCPCQSWLWWYNIQRFTAFSIKEARQHIGLYIFNGITPYSCIEYKIKPQQEDVCHGNDFVYNSSGPRVAHRQKEFKALLAYYNPGIDTPIKAKYPNWKVQPLITWMKCLLPK